MQKPGAQPQNFSGTVKRVLEEAQAHAAELKFADAAQVLAKALAETETGRVALLAESGRVARLQLRYREAAEFYAKATEAASVPGDAWAFLCEATKALYDQGNEFGDNAALLAAIERCRHLVELRPRDAFPQDWAKTQVNLGIALFRLGERESGTARLTEAATAFREALQEFTRTRAA